MFKRKDGRWCEKITFRGKSIYVYGKTPAEVAEKCRIFAEDEMISNTFKEVAERWWEESEGDLARQSVPSYRKAMESAIEYFSLTPIQNITPVGVQAYLRFLASKKYSYTTVSQRRVVLNLICKYAVINGIMSINPCSDVVTPKGLSKKSRPPATYSDEDIVRNNDGIWIFYSLILLAGLRKGEALALRPMDVDFENNLIFVRASVASDRGQPYIKIPKTESGMRTVPLLPKLKQRLLAELPLAPTAYFCNREKVPMDHNKFAQREALEKKRFGITSTPHQFRHSFATICFERGVSPKATQAMLGHKNVSTTLDIYTEARARRLAQEADVLSDL